MAAPDEGPHEADSAYPPNDLIQPTTTQAVPYSRDGILLDRSTFPKSQIWTTSPLHARTGIPPAGHRMQLALQNFPVDSGTYAVRLPDDRSGNARWTWHRPMYMQSFSRFGVQVHSASRDWRALQNQAAAEHREQVAAQEGSAHAQGLDRVAQAHEAREAAEVEQIKQEAARRTAEIERAKQAQAVFAAQQAAWRAGRDSIEVESMRGLHTPAVGSGLQKQRSRGLSERKVGTPPQSRTYTQPPAVGSMPQQTRSQEFGQRKIRKVAQPATSPHPQTPSVGMPVPLLRSQGPAEKNKDLASGIALPSSEEPEAVDTSVDAELRCTNCLRSKKGCDKVRPVCGRCQKNGIGPEGCLAVGHKKRKRSEEQERTTPGLGSFDMPANPSTGAPMPGGGSQLHTIPTATATPPSEPPLVPGEPLRQPLAPQAGFGSSPAMPVSDGPQQKTKRERAPAAVKAPRPTIAPFTPHTGRLTDPALSSSSASRPPTAVAKPSATPMASTYRGTTTLASSGRGKRVDMREKAETPRSQRTQNIKTRASAQAQAEARETAKDSVTQPSKITTAEGVTILHLTSSFSDGTGQATGKKGFVNDNAWLMKAVATRWASLLGMPIKDKDLEYRLDRLPTGYSCYSRNRTSAKGSHNTDREILGVPKGRRYLRSINEYWPHFEWMQNGGTGECGCLCCSKETKGKRDMAVGESGGATEDRMTTRSGAVATLGVGQEPPSFVQEEHDGEADADFEEEDSFDIAPSPQSSGGVNLRSKFLQAQSNMSPKGSGSPSQQLGRRDSRVEGGDGDVFFGGYGNRMQQ